ncbi:MAG: hypothetical protein AAGJ18_21565, partial [Bacteroidota bacterium]
MHLIEKIGLGVFVVALALFTLSLGFEKFQLTAENLTISNEYHKEEILEKAKANGLLGKRYESNFDFIADLNKTLKEAKQSLDDKAKNGLPEGVSEWSYRIGSIKDYKFSLVKSASVGPIAQNPFRWFLLTFGLGILGGLLYIFPKFIPLPGIKNNHIYHNSMTRGLEVNIRGVFLGLTIAGVIIYGFFYMNKNLLWPAITAAMVGLISYLVFFKEKSKENNPQRSASPEVTGWIGVITGIYLIAFYVLLYWVPEYITSWVLMVDPLSRSLSGNPASQWFLYGTLYTIIVLVMGIRMMSKYRHNSYQLVRTGSVMFFQTAIAFLLPEILVRLNQPYFDFKNIWPLNYSFFFDWNINNLINSGGLGIFMFVWGIALILLGVPIITYFF